MAKRALKDLVQRLQCFGDERQKKAARSLLYFFALMLVLTLVSRGMAGMALPRVEAAYPRAAEISTQPGESTAHYARCVPLSALHAAASGYYVLVLENQSSVLGLQIIAVAIPVTILAQDESTAAVSGALGARDRIIVFSSKPVQPNDKVRVAT